MIVKTKISVKIKVEEGWYSEQEMEEDLHWPETLRTKLHKPPKHVLYPKQTLSTKEEAEGSNPGLLGRGAKLLQVGTVGGCLPIPGFGFSKAPYTQRPWALYPKPLALNDVSMPVTAHRTNRYDGQMEYWVVVKEKGVREQEQSRENCHKEEQQARFNSQNL